MSAGPQKLPPSSSTMTARSANDAGTGALASATGGGSQLRSRLRGAKLIGHGGRRGKPALACQCVLDHGCQHGEPQAASDHLRVEGEHQEPTRIPLDQVVDLVPPYLLDLPGVE